MRTLPPTDYAAIRRDFGFEERADRAVAERLSARLLQRPFDPTEVVEGMRLRGKTVYVLGAGAHAARDATSIPNDALLWAADGATSAALEAGRTPFAIVSDLDGKIPDEVEACTRGAVLFVHAHGDNGAAIDRWLGEFPPRRVAGTCQVDPVPEPLLNVGGFTDGDRAVHLALHFGAGEVRLIGFDFQKPGPYSGRKDLFEKPRKLAWAKRILDALIASGAPVRFG